MYLFGSKIKRSKTRNKTARYRAKLKKKNTNRRARMLKA
jgi:ribosomal protein S30